MSVGITGVRKEVISFDDMDDKVKEALLKCIKERGKLEVHLIPKGELMDGIELANAYEQLVD